MKQLPIRKFTTVAHYLSEAVAVTVDGHTIGVYTPLDRKVGEVIGTIDLGPNVSEATVDEVKKAIEPDQVKKVERPGRPPELSKGLGDIPGVTRSDPSFGAPRPAPKPKK